MENYIYYLLLVINVINMLEKKSFLYINLLFLFLFNIYFIIVLSSFFYGI